MEDMLNYLNSLNERLTEEVQKYRKNNKSNNLKTTLENILSEVIEIDISTLKKSDFRDYMSLIEFMTFSSLEIKDYSLGEMIYQKLFPQLTSSSFFQKDLEKTKKFGYQVLP